MTDNKAHCKPRPLAGVNVYALKLTPLEGFIFSQLDGQVSVEQLADICQLPEENVLEAIDNLLKLKAIELPDSDMPTEYSRPAPTAKTEPAVAMAPRSMNEQPQYEEGIYLNAEQQREVDRLLALGEEENPLLILGLTADAAFADVKKSYFKLAKVYHPDRFYGRELGSYQEKLATLFEMINQAFNTLSKPRVFELWRKRLAENPAASSQLKKENSKNQLIAVDDEPPPQMVPSPAKAHSSARRYSSPISQELEEVRQNILKERRQRQNIYVDRLGKADEAMQAAILKLRDGFLLEPCEKIAMICTLVPDNPFYQSLRADFFLDENHPSYMDLLQVEVLVDSGYLDKALAGYAKLSKEYYKISAFHFMESLLLYRQNEVVKAMNAIDKALAVSPEQLLFLLHASRVSVACKNNSGKDYFWVRAIALAKKLSCDISVIGQLLVYKPAEQQNKSEKQAE